MIEFEGVTKVFPGGTVAVDDVNLVAPAGRTTVLMGPPGCGKTTLLRMVNRMLDPSAGRVLIAGEANTAMRRSQLRRGIGYVVAGGGLFPHRTVIRNIETVPVLAGTDRVVARSLATGLLERVGLSAAFAGAYPRQLSPGQQIRVALARALAADPPILLMDSPFGALDPAVRQDLQDDLLDLQRVVPKTILFATHDIDEAIKLGDQIAVLADGRLVQIATPQALLAAPGSEYVADLLGRDRGIRKLTFLAASELPLTPPATIQAGATGSRAKAIAETFGERWLLVLDAERRPRGWVDSTSLAPDAVVSGPVVHPLGGSFYGDESVLAALDAAILSAAGLAVCLDDDGMVLGVINHAEIARYLAGLSPITPASMVAGGAVPVDAPAPVPSSAQAPGAGAGPDAGAGAAAPDPNLLPSPPSPPAPGAPADAAAEPPEQAAGSAQPGGQPAGPTAAMPTQPVPLFAPRPAAAAAAPAVREAPRRAPVVPIPAPAPVLRPAPAKPATVPTVRGGQPEEASDDPVSKWLIRGDQPDSETTPAANGEGSVARQPGAAGAGLVVTGRWEWQSDPGRWVLVADSEPGEGEAPGHEGEQ